MTAGARRISLFIGIAMASAILTGVCQAQILRLSVRPHEMAIATRTERAGDFSIAGLRGGQVHVPARCVGVRRCPLVLYSNYIIGREFLVQAAEKYGFILADVSEPLFDAALHDKDSGSVAQLDTAMPLILQTFAIDPDKIAIIGGSATGVTTATYGAQNQDVFSRVVLYTQQEGDPPARIHQTNEYYISGGLLENVACFEHVQRLRDLGYPVKYLLEFRPHGQQYEDNDFIGRWLEASWAIRDPAARPAPDRLGELPLLTTEVMAQMTAFWTRFMQEPDSIMTNARRAWVREVVVPVGNQQVSTLMVDMAALADRYPSVAAAFRQVGLTPAQHEAYRVALVAAQIYDHAGVGCPRRYPTADSTIRRARLEAAPSSTLMRNVEFLRTHPDDAAALMVTGMWNTP